MEFFGGSTRARGGALDKGADVFLDEDQSEKLYADAKARNLAAARLSDRMSVLSHGATYTYAYTLTPAPDTEQGAPIWSVAEIGTPNRVIRSLLRLCRHCILILSHIHNHRWRPSFVPIKLRSSTRTSKFRAVQSFIRGPV